MQMLPCSVHKVSSTVPSSVLGSVRVLDAVARRLVHGEHQVVLELIGKGERRQPTPERGPDRRQPPAVRRPDLTVERSLRTDAHPRHGLAIPLPDTPTSRSLVIRAARARAGTMGSRVGMRASRQRVTRRRTAITGSWAHRGFTVLGAEATVQRERTVRGPAFGAPAGRAATRHSRLRLPVTASPRGTAPSPGSRGRRACPRRGSRPQRARRSGRTAWRSRGRRRRRAAPRRTGLRPDRAGCWPA